MLQANVSASAARHLAPYRLAARAAIAAALWFTTCASVEAAPAAILQPPSLGPASSAPPAPGRIIVKYRSSIDSCVACAMERGGTLEDLTGTDSLDRIHADLGLRGARALFTDDTEPGPGRAARWASRLAAARLRHPRQGARGALALNAPDLSRIYVLEIAANLDVQVAAARYAADPSVEWAEPDRLWRAVLTPNDPFFGSGGSWSQSYRDLWGLVAVDASHGWDRSIGTGVVVAAIDTGIDHTHPDLAANLWTNPGEIPSNGIDDDGNGFADDVRGWDFADDDANPYDDHGHGTHVAGTIAAVGNNARGVVGVAWGARVMAVRGLDTNGSGLTTDLAAALVYAAENGADVLSNSWGGGVQSQTLIDAVETVRALGVVVLAASGNSGGDVGYHSPSNINGVIAVGATTAAGQRASFSNYGTELSVTAPGVDVLSCRSDSSGPVGGFPVAGEYLRLSGTSMACPHAAGVAALLLSDQPDLTPDEVQWHLELNANQPGSPGWEGDLWNPYFGFGIVDAAQVFDPVPVTTRVRSEAIDLHAFADDIRPDVASAEVGFTTSDSVGWTATFPPWLTPSPAAGSTDATVSLSLDLTGMAPGTATGTLIIEAPDALDGGGSLDATVHVHRDDRIGGVIPIGVPFLENTIPAFPPPAVASDGLGTFVVWSEEVRVESGIFAARIDGAGQVSPAVTLDDEFPQKERVAVAFDGRNYLVVWQDRPRGNGRQSSAIRALRVSPAGHVLDAGPIVLRLKRDTSGSGGIALRDVAFDGESFVVVWSEISSATNNGKTLLRRVGRDGSLREKKPLTVDPSPATATSNINGYIDPRIACSASDCLLAWRVRDLEVDGNNAYVDKIYGTRLVRGRLVDAAPFPVLRGAMYLSDIVSDGDGYVLLAHRFSIAPGPVIRGGQVIVARVDATGHALDPDGIRVDNGYDGLTAYPKGTSIAFDGARFVTVYTGSGSEAGEQIFVNAVTPTGQVIESEAEGLLAVAGAVVAPSNTFYASIAATHTQSVVVWSESVTEPEAQNQLYAQRLLARPSTLPAATIGAIGNRIVAEGAALTFALRAPTLNPATMVFSASDLPPGAIFDVATGAFHWVPAADEAGRSWVAHFEAGDGTQTASELVRLTVSEAIASIRGTALLSNGATPATGVALELKGRGGERRTVFTDRAGFYRFESLAPGRYQIKLGKDSKKTHRIEPRRIQVVLTGGDMSAPGIIATPR